MKHRSLLMSLVVGCLLSVPAGAADGVFDSNGVKIRYVTEGTGVPVVLIHGWMADSSMWGQDQAGNTRLDSTHSHEFQAIALDCRGHGKSDKPHDPGKYGPEMAADVVRLLDHLKIEKAHLIGYSMGAFIAGRVAATHPERVLSVVYAGQGPLVSELEPSKTSAEVEVFAKAVDESRDLGIYILETTPPGMPKPTEEAATAIANFMFAGKDVKALAAAGRSLTHLEVTGEQLKRYEGPILFIHGGAESEGVKNRVAAVRKLLGRGEVRIIEGGDHMTTLARPELGAAVLEFLRSVPAGAGAGPGMAREFKGHELYSWKGEQGQWLYALLPGTNRLKSGDEILSAGIPEADLRLAISELAPGESVSWCAPPGLEIQPRLATPPADVVDGLRALAREHEVRLSSCTP